MEPDIDGLEAQLRAHGLKERHLENELVKLRGVGREAATRGDFTVADEAWTLYETTRAALTDLQKLIYAIENTLFRLRRK